MKRNNFKLYKFLFLCFSIILIASLMGCSGETIDTNRGASGVASVSIEGKPILRVEKNVQFNDSYYFDLTGDYKINVVAGSRVSYSNFNEAKNNGVSLKGLGTEITLTDEALSKGKVSLALSLEGAKDCVFDCEIQVMDPEIQWEIDKENHPKLFVTGNDTDGYKFLTLGGSFNLKLSYYFQTGRPFTSWQEAEEFGFTIEELSNENGSIEISAEEKANSKKAITISLGNIQKSVEFDLVILANGPDISSFEVTKAPVIHLTKLPNYSKLTTSATVACEFENFEIVPVWGSETQTDLVGFNKTINNIKDVNLYGFSFNDDTEFNTITLSKDNIKNKTVNLTIKKGNLSKTVTCAIEADEKDPWMVSFVIKSLPDLVFNSIPTAGSVASYTLSGNFLIECNYDQEPFTKTITTIDEAKEEGFKDKNTSKQYYFGTNSVALTSSELSSRKVSVELNSSWDITGSYTSNVSVKKVPLSIKSNTSTAKAYSVEVGTTYTLAQLQSAYNLSASLNWYSDADYKNAVSFPITINAATSLYGVNSYTVKFQNASGTQLASPQTVLHGKTITNPNITTPNGYIWLANGSKTTNILTYKITSDTTFVLSNNDNITVTYKRGPSSSSTTITSGKSIEESKTYAKVYESGSVVSKQTAYYLDKELLTKVTWPLTPVQDMTLHADYIGIEGYKRVEADTTAKLVNALTNLQSNTLIVLKPGATYDLNGYKGLGSANKPSKFNNTTINNWASQFNICIAVDNVAIVCFDSDKKTTIYDSSETSSTVGGLIGILGNNVCIANIQLGSSSYSNYKVVDVRAEGGTKLVYNTYRSDVYVGSLKTSSTDYSAPGIKHCHVWNGRIDTNLIFTGGASGTLVMESVSLSASSALKFIGNNGNNNLGLDITSSDSSFYGNYYKGCKIIFEERYSGNLSNMETKVNPTGKGFTLTSTTTNNINGITSTVKTYTY